MATINRSEASSAAFQTSIVSLMSDFRNNSIGEKAFYASMYPKIYAFCKYVKNHKRASYFNEDILDDVAQRVMINIFKWGDNIDLTQNSMGYLYKMVLREVYQSNKENSVIRVNGQTDEEGNKIHFAGVDSIDKEVFDGAPNNFLDVNLSEFSEINSQGEHGGDAGSAHVDSRLDRESALNKIANLVVKTDGCLYYQNNKSYKHMKENLMNNNNTSNGLTGYQINPTSIVGVSNTPLDSLAVEVKETSQLEAPIPAKNKKRLDLDNMSEPKKELYRIKELLNLSLEEFAERVGVNTPVMSSYLYRDNVNPRQWVVDAAKKLEEENSEICAKVTKLKNEYGNLNMAEILKLWSDKLNFDLNNTKVVAQIFDTTPTTILRWKNSCNKPPLLNILSYYEVAVLNIRTNPALLTMSEPKKVRAVHKKKLEAAAIAA